MQNAKFWIENNPETGSVKPFEIFWQIEGKSVIKCGSCKTHENAMKSIKGSIKRNAKYFNIDVVEGAQ